MENVTQAEDAIHHLNNFKLGGSTLCVKIAMSAQEKRKQKQMPYRARNFNNGCTSDSGIPDVQNQFGSRSSSQVACLGSQGTTHVDSDSREVPDPNLIVSSFRNMSVNDRFVQLEQLELDGDSDISYDGAEYPMGRGRDRRRDMPPGFGQRIDNNNRYENYGRGSRFQEDYGGGFRPMRGRGTDQFGQQGYGPCIEDSRNVQNNNDGYGEPNCTEKLMDSNSKDMYPSKRWLKYGAMGDVVTGTNFVPFKVPLKQTILANVEVEHRFGPQDAIQKIKDKGKVLGLVIDVTNADKYYDREEFGSRNIEHEKIYFTSGVVPRDAIIKRFFYVVEKFKKRTTSEDVVIGVHCKHGLNRTGYIICRYMIERLGFDPLEAIEAFNKARGHKIEKQKFIKDLLTRKHNPDLVVVYHPPVLKVELKGGNYRRHSDRHRTGPNHDTRDITDKQDLEQKTWLQQDRLVSS